MRDLFIYTVYMYNVDFSLYVVFVAAVAVVSVYILILQNVRLDGPPLSLRCTDQLYNFGSTVAVEMRPGLCVCGCTG